MSRPESADEVLTARALEARAGNRTLFRGLDLGVRPGHLVAVTGPNGCGKSTLLRILLGLLRPVAGTVRRHAACRVAYVPQLDPGDPGLPFPADCVVAQGLPGTGLRGGAARRAVARALERVGYRAPPGRRYTRLSGGERRRVLLARALVAEPSLLALDEPTAGVDAEGEREVVDVVRTLAREDAVAVVWVCHALPDVEAAADAVVRLGSAA